MKILAIDTATDACSAALFLDGEVTSRFELAPRRHTELILPMVGSLLEEAGLAVTDLDAVAFGRGPGAFTGLRIAAGVAQGLALGADLPVIPVSTLATMAQQVMDEAGAEAVAAALDARMGEVYWGCYRRDAEGVAEPVGPETVCAPQAVPVP
ncbi:MAG TPA: tRNA (adenosine(37)-N6)-threonylcarbamoyltransferase complex dimerization subunit type 1 TsaB, partial [Thioalkalivibrio sp.]|nr:tRNA (adenosine(37)-N6)-threonylcarbamoyltransferase complex dimerization subunit type 1 TsaB [Thioalkalivibrio sp.]